MSEPSKSSERWSGLYWSGIAKGLGCCAALMTAISAFGVVVGRARGGNFLGMLIFGAATYLLFNAGRSIRAASSVEQD